MKILITTDWYRPVVNGVVTSVTALSGALRALGHDVRILTLSGDHRSYASGGVYYLGSVGVGAVYPNARLRMTRGDELAAALIAWRPDVVHSQCEFSTFAAARRIARACHCPLVHTYHTVYEDLTHYFSPNEPLGRRLAELFTRHVLAQTDAVIAPTDKTRALLLRYGVAAPVFTVPTGIPLAPFGAPEPPAARQALRASLGLGPDDLTLVYVGRLAHEKNVGELISLLGRAPESVKLLLVGDGPERGALEAQSRAPGLSGRVIFAGMAAPERVAAYYKAGDIFVSASACETQGLTYIEAMACGLPLLCRADACLRGVLEPGKTGWFYKTPEEFSAALCALSDGPARQAFGASARRASERFSAGRFARAALAVYESARGIARGGAAA